MTKPEIPKYPFERVGPAAKPSKKTLKSLARSDYSSGKGKQKGEPSKRFLDREKKIAVKEKPVHGVRPPKWLLARFAKHVPVSVVIEDLFKYLRRDRSEKNMRFTQYGLNEIGRRRGGGRLLRKTLSQEVVDEFQAKGEK